MISCLAVDYSDGTGPSVDAALSMSPSTAIQQMEGVKSTIGMRKPAAAKKGVGIFFLMCTLCGIFFLMCMLCLFL